MKGFIKTSYLFLLVLFVFAIFGCEMSGGGTETKKVVTPTDFAINESIISFTEVKGATKYRLEIRNTETDEVLRRFVVNGDDLNALNIPEGEYMIKIQAINANNVESEYSEELPYKQADLYAVKSIEGDHLIDGNYIKWMGRTSYNEATKVNTMYYTAAGFEVKFQKLEEELSLSVTLTATNYATVSKQPYMVFVLDNDFDHAITINLTQATQTLQLIGGDSFIINDEAVHVLSVYKRSESIDSHVGLKKLETNGRFISGVTYKTRKIEMIAASSSTGYGNLSNSTKTTANSDGLKAFAFLTAQALNAEINIVSASGWGVSASLWTSPNTLNMHDQYKYVDVFSTELWDTNKFVPDVVITNFGTNDLSYINAGSDATIKAQRRENFIATYVDFLNNLHQTYPNAQIIILYGLMNESGVYDDHTEIFNRAVVTIPNLAMYKINGDAQGYNSHPSVASHRQIADTLIANIKELMNW